MLSFLRDEGLENLPGQKSAAPAAKTPKMPKTPKTPKTPDNANEKPQEQEYLTVAVHEKQVRKSTITLAVVFVIGLLCLFFMIKKSTPESASAETGKNEQTQIEKAIARLTGVKSEIFGRMGEIVNKFYEFSKVPQVRVNELAKNPFELEMFSADLDPELNAQDENPGIDPQLVWQQQIRQQAKDMRLLSIIKSEMGDCCVIDGIKLSEGDSIKGFKVCKIDIKNSLVKLESNGVEIIFKLTK